MTSIVEVIARLQTAIDFLENEPGSPSSSSFAQRVFSESAEFDDFTLVRERRARIKSFLDALQDLDDGDGAIQSSDIAADVFKDFYELRQSLDEVNIFDRALNENYNVEEIWDPFCGCWYCVDECLGDAILREGLISDSWVVRKLLSDMLKYYRSHILINGILYLFLMCLNMPIKSLRRLFTIARTGIL